MIINIILIIKGACIAYLRFDYIEKNKEHGGEGMNFN